MCVEHYMFIFFIKMPYKLTDETENVSQAASNVNIGYGPVTVNHA